MAEGKIHYIPVETLQSFMRDVFVKAGLSAEDAQVCSEVLIKSDLRGVESHGIGRLKMYIDRIRSGQLNPKSQFEIVRQSPTTALVDGHYSLGMVIAKKAMQLAIDKAKVYGMGSVAVRNSSHFGIDGYYPLMAVENGMVGMSFTNARPSISPTFGVQPMLGTNPIAFGCPTDEECPFLFDAATSITQRGKFEVLQRKEKPSNPGWVTDQDGNGLTDAGAVIAGLGKDTVALLPLGGAGEDMGGHKGYGLAVMVEILSSSMSLSPFMHGLLGYDKDKKPIPFMVGHFFMAINIEAFVDLDEFKRNTGEILRELRASRKAPEQKRIYTANEKEFEMEKHVRQHGVPAVPNLQKDIIALREMLDIRNYDFPF